MPWSLFPLELHMVVWLAIGVLGLLLWLFVSYYLLRWLAGHRKFRGTWYSQRQFAELVKVTAEDQDKGHRVMSREEIALLRRYRCGGQKGIGFDKADGYF